MNVSLVAMPWISLAYPSMALGILRARVQSSVPGARVTDHYGNLAWTERLLASRDAGTACTLYETLAGTIFDGIGEWVFARALRGERPERDSGLYAFAEEKGIDVGMLREVSDLAIAFADEYAARILASDPDVVGFTTTFSQNVPSLAVAERIKRLRPDVRVVFGGANCDGIQGVGLHRNFPFVDFAIRGEGEQSFVALIEALRDDSPLEPIRGLCWRDEGGAQRVNPESGMIPFATVPAPDYDGWIEQIDASPLRTEIKPILVLETARGCWWGEKSHCTFCGLNGSTMTFRSKPPAQARAEIMQAVARYKLLDVMMVDNILDTRYFDTLLPELERSDLDLRVHYEVKANLDADQIDALQRAKVVHIQPGIESLDSTVLKIMRKGVSGPQNIVLLRESESVGLTVAWNYLFGFPDESAADYEKVLAQVPNLYHLQPPSGAARIQIERFSPFEKQPELGFADKKPARFYRWIYDLDDAALEDMVFLFDAPPAGIGSETAATLADAITLWKESYEQSSLDVHAYHDGLVFHDARAGREPRVVHVTDRDYVLMYETLRKPWSADGLRNALNAGRAASAQLSAETVRAFLDEFVGLGLLFENCGKYVALACTARRRAIKGAVKSSAA